MKKSRHEKIMELVEEYDIETQEELADFLQKAGYPVTQATVSRDIRELQLLKVSTGGGHQKYVLMQEQQDTRFSDRYVRVLKEGFVSMDAAQQLLVIHTVSGMAMAVAAALDDMKLHEILGSIAGDDTIFVATRSNEDALEVMRRIKEAL
ncbi:MAG: arginine repressor [Lachnospiraceae bacterium]|nr:arginine repressor [Lachnospiraceae bacterium]